MSGARLKDPGRRKALKGLIVATLAARCGTAGAAAPLLSRVRPGEPGWPDADAWAELSRAVGGRLAPVALPVLDDADAPAMLSNPYYLRDQPGLTQSSGWIDA